MKITFDEMQANKELWLHSELLQSVTGEVIQKAAADRFYDVKLVVNGIEIEPKIYNKVMQNIDSYIEHKANQIVAEKLKEAEDEAFELLNVVREAKDRIHEKFNI